MRNWIPNFRAGRQAIAESSDPEGPESKVPAVAETVDWVNRLQTAVGDDAALLALTRERAPLDVKLAAVEALAGEAALKAAEAEFRDRDRRVHRLAKQRLGHVIALRETRAQAAAVIDSARALSRQEPIPVNLLVDIDRAWRVLNPELVDATQRQEYESLMAQMSALTREHADRRLALTRWSAEADAALQDLRRACSEAASGEQGRGPLAAAGAAARRVAESAPADATGAPVLAELTRADALRAQLDDRLAVLDDLLREPAPGKAARAGEAAPGGAVLARAVSRHSVPGEAAQAEAAQAEAAQAEAVQGEAVQGEAVQGEALQAEAVQAEAVQAEALQAEAVHAEAVHAEPGQAEPVQGEPVQDEVVSAAAAPGESVQAEAGRGEAGQADAGEGVAAPGREEQGGRPPAAVGEAGASSAAAQRWNAFAPLEDAALESLLQQRFGQWQQARHDAATARRAARREAKRDHQREIRDQHGRALAQALEQAEATLEAGHPTETHGQLVEIDRLLEAGAPAGALRARIDALRARYAQLKGWQHWAGGRARDDLVHQAEALAAATGDHAAGRAAKLTIPQRIAVIDDMRKRWKELDHLGGATSRSLWQRFEAALKTAYAPVSAQAAAQRAAREQNLQSRLQLLETLEAVPLPADGDEAAPPPDPRALASALDHFQTAWRRLGPVEHTVPHKARGPLGERMAAAVQRIEAPLNEARRGARAEREELVARARALATGAPGRELVPQVRELQAQWQQHARARPLSRADEATLWGEFKAAIDGAFDARKAAFDARDAEFRSHGAERAALIERLQALGPDTPAAELRRTLAEVDAQWRRAGAPPRHDAAALEARFRDAHERVQRWLGESARRGWHVTCDALEAKLALCEEVERAADKSEVATAIAPRWSELPALPDPLEQVLAARAGVPTATARRGAASIDATTDELLLQLEFAWGLESPPAFEAARRALKLQAMKAALDSRRPASAPVTPPQWLAELLRRGPLDELQRQRRDAVLAALRRRGSLGTA